MIDNENNIGNSLVHSTLLVRKSLQLKSIGERTTLCSLENKKLGL